MLAISNRPCARPILKLLAWLLPELYSTQSNYYYKLFSYESKQKYYDLNLMKTAKNEREQ